VTHGSIRVGIGGWTYEPWRGGAFYPVGLPHRRELEYAASRLSCIEINATYYRRQKPESFARWAAATPEGFRFSLKALQYTMRRKVLADSKEIVGKFLDQGFTALGDRLGPILWQFREGKRFEREDFARFLDLIPDRQDGVALQHVLEVRDVSFCDQLSLTSAAIAILPLHSPTTPSFRRSTSRRRISRTRGCSSRMKLARPATNPRRSASGRSAAATGHGTAGTPTSCSSRARSSATRPQRGL